MARNPFSYGAVGNAVLGAPAALGTPTTVTGINDTKALQAFIDDCWYHGDECIFPVGSFLIDGLDIYAGMKIRGTAGAQFIMNGNGIAFQSLASPGTRGLLSTGLDIDDIVLYMNFRDGFGFLIESAIGASLRQLHVYESGINTYTYDDGWGTPSTAIYPSAAICLKGNGDATSGSGGCFFTVVDQCQAIQQLDYSLANLTNMGYVGGVGLLLTNSRGGATAGGSFTNLCNETRVLGGYYRGFDKGIFVVAGNDVSIEAVDTTFCTTGVLVGDATIVGPSPGFAPLFVNRMMIAKHYMEADRQYGIHLSTSAENVEIRNIASSSDTVMPIFDEGANNSVSSQFPKGGLIKTSVYSTAGGPTVFRSQPQTGHFIAELYGAGGAGGGAKASNVVGSGSVGGGGGAGGTIIAERDVNLISGTIISAYNNGTGNIRVQFASAGMTSGLTVGKTLNIENVPGIVEANDRHTVLAVNAGGTTGTVDISATYVSGHDWPLSGSFPYAAAVWDDFDYSKYTIGSGGVAVAAGAGGGGGSSTFGLVGDDGATVWSMTANGGSGGTAGASPAVASSIVAGGAGGSTSSSGVTTNYAHNGEFGERGELVSSIGYGGRGGATTVGEAGLQRIFNGGFVQLAGQPGSGLGVGGNGAVCFGSGAGPTDQAGGAGRAGMLLVREFAGGVNF